MNILDIQDRVVVPKSRQKKGSRVWWGSGGFLPEEIVFSKTWSNWAAASLFMTTTILTKFHEKLFLIPEEREEKVSGQKKWSLFVLKVTWSN